jgi:hypothetical protein
VFDTLATVAFDVAHDKGVPVSTAPAASRTVTERVSVPPMSIALVGAVISTVDTVAVTGGGPGGSVDPPHPRSATSGRMRGIGNRIEWGRRDLCNCELPYLVPPYPVP